MDVTVAEHRPEPCLIHVQNDVFPKKPADYRSLVNALLVLWPKPIQAGLQHADQRWRNAFRTEFRRIHLPMIGLRCDNDAVVDQHIDRLFHKIGITFGVINDQIL